MDRRRGGGRGGRLSRHPRRHRQPHDDGQRPGGARLGRRRHRGRSGDARPASLDGRAGGRRRTSLGRAPRGRDGDRSRAAPHRHAARRGGGREIRGVLRAGPRLPASRRPRYGRQHGARIRRHLRFLPHRRGDPALSPLHRARRAPLRAGGSLRPRPGPVARRRLARTRLFENPRARSRDGQTEPRRSAPAAGPRGPRRRPRRFRGRTARAPRPRPRRDAPRRGRGGRVGTRRRRRRHRRDHQLHQHFEPRRHDRRRPAGAQRPRPRPRRQAVGQDLARPGVEGGHRLPRPSGPRPRPRGARLPSGRLRVHDLHRQFRPASRTGRTRRRRRRTRRRRGAVGEPQFRGPHPPARPRQLPRLAAARRRLRAGRVDTDRPLRRPAGNRPGRARGPAARHLASGPRDRRYRRPRGLARNVRARLWRRLRGRRRMARDPRAPGRRLRLAGLRLCAQAALFRRHDPRTRRRERHKRRAGAGGARRLGHHRSYLAGRRHPPRRSRRRLAGGARRRPGGLQFLRRAARQPRGDDARRLRQCQAPQRAGARNRRRLDARRRRRRTGGDLRRRTDLRRARRAARHRRRTRIRRRVVARLGRQGPHAARRARRHRRELRAHPPLQPHRHGSPAAPVPTGGHTARPPTRRQRDPLLPRRRTRRPPGNGHRLPHRPRRRNERRHRPAVPHRHR